VEFDQRDEMMRIGLLIHEEINQKGAGVFETLLVCILLSILIGTVIPYYQKLAYDAREVALQSSLMNLRKAIELYTILQGKYPPDLKSLVNRKYVIPVRDDTFFSGEYLRDQVTDAEGNLLDPFGSRYRYDSKKGKVSSLTEGYESL
jgi:type II secretory pathway pseudopilin PulG